MASTHLENLSLCILTKDNENTLLNCISSVKEVVNEVIVIDMGSTDKTRSIAKEAGAKIFKKKWNNDYSAMKNFALKKSRGKWILFLEADEVMKDAKNILSLLDNPMVEGYLFFVDTFIRTISPSIRTQSLRLFRNREEYQYKHRVFEKIPEHVITNTKSANIVIQKKMTAESYLENKKIKEQLLPIELKEHPTDPYFRYIYGIELYNQRDFNGSIEQFNLAIKYGDPYYVFSSHLYKLIIMSYMEIHNYDDAIKVAKQAIDIFPQYTDLHFYLGQSLIEINHEEEAIVELEICLKLGEANSSMLPEAGLGSYKAAEALGAAHENIHNWQKALDYYKNAYQIYPSYKEPIYRIGSLLKKVPTLGKINEVIPSILDITKEESLLTFIDILSLEREYKAALSYTSKLEEIIGQNEDTFFIRGICNMMLKNSNLAEEFYQTIPHDHSYYGHVLLRRIQNFWFHDQEEAANRLLIELQQHKNISSSIKQIYKLIHAVLYSQVTPKIKLDSTNKQVLTKTIEHLLWLKQTEKAKLLFPYLLEISDQNQWIAVAVAFAKYKNLEVIEALLNLTENNDLEKRLKTKVAETFYLQNEFHIAYDFLDFKQPHDYGMIGHLIWSKFILKKVQESIYAGLRSSKTDALTKEKLTQIKELI